MNHRSERGQATTEYLMISGLITAMGILILGYMQSPLRRGLQCVTEYVIGQALDPPFEGFSLSGLTCGGGVGPLGGGLGGLGGGGLGGFGGGLGEGIQAVYAAGLPAKPDASSTAISKIDPTAAVSTVPDPAPSGGAGRTRSRSKAPGGF